MRCLSAGGGQDAQGADERAGYIPRAVRPHSEAARHNRVGMIAAPVLYVFLLNAPLGSGHFKLVMPSR